MKFSVSLFLLFFMLQNTFSIMDVSIVPNKLITFYCPLQIDYDPETVMDSEQAYIFSQVESYYCSIIYVVGVHSKPYQKVMAARYAVRKIKQRFGEVSERANIHFTRKTSDSLKTFGDVGERENVFDKIPRLYGVGIGGIFQLPMKRNSFKNGMAFLFHDGFDVTIYHPYSLSNEIIKIANSFAKYINEFQKTKYDVDTRISRFEGQKNFEAFCSIIKNRLKILLQNKSNSLQKNDVVNFETINQELDEKINIVDYEEDEEVKSFETLFNDTIKELYGDESANEFDDSIYERILSSFTASTSSSSASSTSSPGGSTSTAAGSARQKVKRNTTRKGKKKSSKKSQSANVATTITKDCDFTILGSGECDVIDITYPIESIVPTCVYIIAENDIDELLIYFGRQGRASDYEMAVTAAETFISIKPFGNVSYIVDDGQLTPPFFMIYFKRELEYHLGMSFLE